MNRKQLDKLSDIISEKRMHTRVMIGKLLELEGLIGDTPEVTTMLAIYRDEQHISSNRLENIWAQMVELKG